MPTGALTYNGVTLIGARSDPVGNGEGSWSIAEEQPLQPVEYPIELQGVSGLGGVLRDGNYNTEDSSGRILIAGKGDRRVCAYFTSQSAAATWIANIEAARLNASSGTAVLGSRGSYAVWFRDFQRGPIERRTLGNCSFAVDFAFLFIRL